MKLRPQLALILLVFALIAPSAFAQSFYWNTASARSTALGGVVVPSASDPLDALAANPAALTSLSAPSVDLSVSVIQPRGSFSNSVNTDAQLSKTPGALPYMAFGMPVRHSRFSFGVGFLPDLMSEADWHYVDPPGTAGVTYGMQQQKSAILAGRLTAGVGFALTKRISLGATVGADYNSNTLIAPYIFQSQPQLQGLKTLLNLHTTGYGMNESVGALIRPTRKLELGVAWKSDTVIVSHGSAYGDAYALFEALKLYPPANPSNFTYNAQVHNVLPQSVLGSIAWYGFPRWVLAFQTDWVNWGNAFVNLPVTLTNGTNATINSVVNSTSLVDGIPLNWKDQYSYHMGVERILTERISARFGYAYANNPVPGSTLTPLTAAIMSNQISTGLSYKLGRARVDAAYTFDPTATAHVGTSALQAGEYDNSTVKVGTQSLMLNYAFQF